jgi:hypothetical protein
MRVKNMFQLIRVIILAVRGIIGVSTPTKPSSEYQPGIKGYDKAYFDEYYQFLFFKIPIKNMPTNIAIYYCPVKNITHCISVAQRIFISVHVL